MRDKVAVIGNITVDRVVRRGVIKGYSPGGAINPAYILKELIPPEHVLLVSNIGVDYFAKNYIEPELEKMNDEYVRRVKDAETRLYEVDVSKPNKPKITMLKEAQRLTNTLLLDITPVLPTVSAIYFQSYATVFERRYRDKTYELIRRVYGMNVPVILDWNKRRSVERIKTIDKQEEVLNMLHTLKMNEGEAKEFVEPKNKKKIDKIRLRKGELERLIDKIMDNYDINRLVITRGERGNCVQTRHESFWFDALKPQLFENSLGAGDASSVPYLLEGIKGMDEVETNVLSNLLGSLATENMFSYPHSITRTRIRQSIITKPGCRYCKKYGLNPREFAHKLGLL